MNCKTDNLTLVYLLDLLWGCLLPWSCCCVLRDTLLGL